MEILLGIIVFVVIIFIIGGIDNDRPVSTWSDEKLARMLPKLKHAASENFSAGHYGIYKKHADKASEVRNEIERRENKNQRTSEENLEEEPGITVAIEDRAEDENDWVITEKAFSAAENGDIKAQLLIGNAYIIGSHGLPQDSKKALKYLSKAAGQGNAHAYLVLSGLFFEGIGFPKDIDKARAFASGAKSLGHPDADDMIRAIDSLR